MKNTVLLIIAALLFLGCSTVRYSPAEIKGFPPEVQEHIKAGNIFLGMSQQQVRYAWDAPSSINILKPKEDGKLREEWIYRGSMGLYKTRLIFVEGELTEIISSDPTVKGSMTQAR